MSGVAKKAVHVPHRTVLHVPVGLERLLCPCRGRSGRRGCSRWTARPVQGRAEGGREGGDGLAWPGFHTAQRTEKAVSARPDFRPSALRVFLLGKAHLAERSLSLPPRFKVSPRHPLTANTPRALPEARPAARLLPPSPPPLPLNPPTCSSSSCPVSPPHPAPYPQHIQPPGLPLDEDFYTDGFERPHLNERGGGGIQEGVNGEGTHGQERGVIPRGVGAGGYPVQALHVHSKLRLSANCSS